MAEAVPQAGCAEQTVQEEDGAAVGGDTTARTTTSEPLLVTK